MLWNLLDRRRTSLSGFRYYKTVPKETITLSGTYWTTDELLCLGLTAI